jgi:hypothetical protein
VHQCSGNLFGFARGDLSNDCFVDLDFPPFLLVAGAVLCSKALETKLQFPLRFDTVAVLGSVLLIYSICTFVYEYRTTGGATSVGLVDGHYVSKSKDHVIRVITADEYKMFPNLWARVMSAWIAMMAVFCAKSFVLPPATPDGRHAVSQ